MRIGLDVRMMALDAFRTRGMGRYVTQLSAALSELDQQNQYVMLTSCQQDLIGQHESYSVGELPTYSKTGMWTQHVQFPETATRAHLDLVHFPFSEYAPARPVRGTKAVLTVCDLIRFQNFPHTFKYSLAEKLYKRALRSADAIITISTYVRNEVEAYLGKVDVPVAAIHLGVNTTVFRPIDSATASIFVRERFGIPMPFILYTGGFDGRKQVADLVRVFHALIQEAKIPHTLVLVGRIAAYESFVEILRSIVGYKLQGRVIFTDYVADTELVQLYNAADVFAFPSSAEGFGLPLLEAMACGTPVIAFRNTSIPEIADDAATLVEPQDWNTYTHTLLGILSNQGAKLQQSAHEIERASQFTWHTTARQTLAVYQQLAG